MDSSILKLVAPTSGTREATGPVHALSAAIPVEYWPRIEDDRRVDDWRLMGQERYLQGRWLTLREWWPYREGWDHDHCAFCQRHISVPLASDDADAVERGYVTEDDYHWICEQCYHDFREQFGWTVTG